MATDKNTIFNFWPYNLLIDVFYKPEIAERAYVPAVESTVMDLPDPTMSKVLLARYRDGQKLQQAALAMNVSPERVRQIQSDGLAKLRHPTYTVKMLTISPAEAAALNRRIRELSRACGEEVPEPSMSILDDDSPIEALNLSTRSYNGLRRMKVRMLGDIRSLSAHDMLKARGMGIRSLREVAQAVAPYGIEMDLTALDPKAGSDG